jgi:vacuolar-type H+-ATPase catalytic subunit A/Vma1
MKKIITVLVVSIILFACSSKKDGDMVVEGNIKGLKKGTLYLQKIIDAAIVSVDSVAVFGDGNFSVTDNVISPEIYYLTFKGNTVDKRILFFGNKGTITINDNMDTFGFNPEIIGSENQLVFNKFLKINDQFKNQRLQFIKKEFDAVKSKNLDSIEKVKTDFKKMIRRKYLFTANFALTNSGSEAAPYIALTELYDANIKLLDTINKSLSVKVKKSTYGKRLDTYVSEIKNKENK